MRRFPRITVILLSAAGALPALGASLPDTGQNTCYGSFTSDTVPAASRESIARDTGTFPRQDCRYGRDAAADMGALSKAGAGPKGFDYTKITNASTATSPGVALGSSAFDWACTLDNTTGLMWEVKTATSTDVRYSGHTYTWLNSDASANGGGLGSSGVNTTCGSTLPGNTCNTAAFVAAVNALSLCTYHDWRLPTRRELLTLVLADGTTASISPTYFPNGGATNYWTGTTYVFDPATAWTVQFIDGGISPHNKSSANAVRLVRGGPF